MNEVANNVKELSSQLIDALKPVAQKLGEGAASIYHMAVKDALISGIESWIYVGLGLALYVLPIVAYKVTWRKKKVPVRDGAISEDKSSFKEEYEFDDDARLASVIIPLIAAGIFGTLTIVLNIGSALHYTLNPEYMALKDLLNTVKH